MPSRFPNKMPIDPMGKFIGGGMGLVSAGIGVTVLIFLWGAPFGEFGSPPLFSRVFGSFIALGFVIFGVGMFLGITRGKKTLNSMIQSNSDEREQEESKSEAGESNTPPTYTCSHCGAPLAKGAEVSPHGDVKCSYCNAWFNIHGQ
jgi:hypothetical protein